MTSPHKHVLLVGATAGIGAAMADKLIEEGSKVTAVGRRAERLDDFVAKHGEEKASGVQFDITDREGTDAFIKNVLAAHPDIDCVILNAGTQHPVDLCKPEQVDLGKFHAEINTNYICQVDLTVKLLPFLLSKPSTLVFVGSHLGFVPAIHLPAYSSSKAALASFALSLREQTRDSSLKVVDLWPPPVQTELHDYMGEEKGRAFGMPVKEFVNEAYAELLTGKEEILIGAGPAPKELLNPLVEKRRELTEEVGRKMRVMRFHFKE